MLLSPSECPVESNGGRKPRLLFPLEDPLKVAEHNRGPPLGTTEVIVPRANEEVRVVEENGDGEYVAYEPRLLWRLGVPGFDPREAHRTVAKT